jgi:tol-pal system protein YbgF
MKKGFSSVVTLFLLFAVLQPGFSQSKRIYELIYEDLQRLAQQVVRLEEKIEQNSEDIKALQKILEDLLALSRSFQSEQASLKEDQRQIPPQFQIITSKLDALNRNLNIFSEELREIKKIVQTPPLPAPDEQAKKGKTEIAGEEKGETEQTEEQAGEEAQTQELAQLSPQEVYNIAYSDYLKGNYQLAVDGFKLFLEQFSDSPVADDAAYWIGECFFSQGQYKEAASQFTELILNFPEGDKIPAAYLKKGLCLLELENKDEALAVFKLLISKYPFEEETKLAQEKIKEIR